MRIVYDREGLATYMRDAVAVTGDNPVLIDRYLADATEVDVDCLADGKDVFVAGIMEHIEEAGIHSGDSACSLPPFSLKLAVIGEIRRQTEILARALKVVGPDERAVRGQGRHSLHPRGQSARQPHGAVRRQGHRRSDRQDRGAGDGRRAAGLVQAGRSGRSTMWRSRRRCSPSRASPASTSCSARR